MIAKTWLRMTMAMLATAVLGGIVLGSRVNNPFNHEHPLHIV